MMFLKSIRVKNYRVHRDVEVQFDRKLTMIHGPNESGKSTLVEAAHRALFQQAKSKSAIIDSMLSNHTGEPPQVELTFVANGQEYKVAKKFSGAGSTQLRCSDGVLLRNEDAEIHVAQILGLTALPGSKRGKEVLQKTWSHLWVWQEKSTSNVFSEQDAYQDALASSLQANGVSALVQSDRDARIKEEIKQIVEGIFNPVRGGFKTDSDVAKAERSVANANETLRAKEDRNKALRDAAEQFDAAAKRLGEIEVLKSKSKADHKKALEDQNLSKELLHKTQSKKLELGGRTGEYSRMHQAHMEYESFQKERLALDGQLASSARELVAARESHDRLKIATENLHREVDQLEKRLLVVRLRSDIFEKHAQLQREAQEESSLKKAKEDIDKMHAEQLDLVAKRASIPNVSAEDLADIMALDVEVSRARAKLEPVAASIKVICSRLPVTVEGRGLGVESEMQITIRSEVCVGDETKIIISPGVGNSLDEAVRGAEEASKNLEVAFTRLKVKTIDEAANFQRQGQTIDANIASINARLKDLNADTLPGRLAASAVKVSELQSTVEKLGSSLRAGLDAVEDIDQEPREGQTWLDLLTDLGASLAASKQKLEETRKSAEVAMGQAQKIETAEISLKHRLKAADAAMQQVESTHGDTAQRTEKIGQLKVLVDALDQEHRDLQAKYQALQPDSVAGRISSLEKAIAQMEQEELACQKAIAVSNAALRHDGNSDIHADLDAAKSAHEFAEANYLRLAAEANGWKLLRDTFEKEQQKLSQSLTEPLQDKITSYVQCIMPDVRSVSFTGGQFGGLSITRGRDRGILNFDQLSGGAREQFGAAARLAVAEVLASSSSDGLPIVFDDAFTFSDSQRLELLPAMIQCAVNAGLQVILLTCNPALYAGLEGKRVELARG